jgi:hypothetical protein
MSWYIKTFDGSELMFVPHLEVIIRRYMAATLDGHAP